MLDKEAGNIIKDLILLQASDMKSVHCTIS